MYIVLELASVLIAHQIIVSAYKANLVVI